MVVLEVLVSDYGIKEQHGTRRPHGSIHDLQASTHYVSALGFDDEVNRPEWVPSDNALNSALAFDLSRWGCPARSRNLAPVHFSLARKLPGFYQASVNLLPPGAIAPALINQSNADTTKKQSAPHQALMSLQ